MRLQKHSKTEYCWAFAREFDNNSAVRNGARAQALCQAATEHKTISKAVSTLNPIHVKPAPILFHKMAQLVQARWDTV
jgi:hypothetical protein